MKPKLVKVREGLLLNPANVMRIDTKQGNSAAFVLTFVGGTTEELSKEEFAKVVKAFDFSDSISL